MNKKIIIIFFLCTTSSNPSGLFTEEILSPIVNMQLYGVTLRRQPSLPKNLVEIVHHLRQPLDKHECANVPLPMNFCLRTTIQCYVITGLQNVLKQFTTLNELFIKNIGFDVYVYIHHNLSLVFQQYFYNKQTTVTKT